MVSTRGVFVTGVGTGVGKTRLCVQIARDQRARGRTVGAYKPACSGAEFDALGRPVWSDVNDLAAAIGHAGDDSLICPQRFLAAAAPPVAAALEHRNVDAALLRSGAEAWRGRVEFLVVEGAGGWLSPLSETDVVADVAADLRFPVIVVSRTGLGSINETLLTVESIRRRRLPVAGIVFNDAAPPDPHDISVATNAREIERRCGVPVLGRIPWHGDSLLHAGQPVDLDWMVLANGGAWANL